MKKVMTIHLPMPLRAFCDIVDAADRHFPGCHGVADSPLEFTVFVPDDDAPPPTSAPVDDDRRVLLIEGVAAEDYFDDQGTHYGLSVDDTDGELSVTLRSVLGVAGASREDHVALHRLVGKRLQITVEVDE